MSFSDDFDDFPDLTEEDLAELDRLDQERAQQDPPSPPPPSALPRSSQPLSSPTRSSQGVRHVDVELELELAIDRSLEQGDGDESSVWVEGDSAFLSSLGEDEIEDAIARQLAVDEPEDEDERMPEHPSLFALYRRRNFFSITDLTAPVWCEVQYDYSLRGKRFLQPSDRPTTFLTANGKTIEPDRDKAVENDRTMKRGTKIHKQLEREIHPVEIKVDANSKEEIWALRILNMLASLEALMALGKCREMPVMGFVKGHLVVGIIDEIQRRPLATEAVSSSPTKAKAPEQANKITSYFAASPEKGKGKAKVDPPTHALYLSDSKTRKLRSLPREDACLAGKLQLQAYHYLLSALLRPPPDPETESDPSPDAPADAHPAFSFAALFVSLGLSSTALLSDEFLAQAQVLIDGNGLECSAATLDDLTHAWERAVARLGVDRAGGCAKELELVYRYQDPGKGKRVERRGKGKRKLVDAGEVGVGAGGSGRTLSAEEEEERILSLAIQASLGADVGGLEEVAGVLDGEDEEERLLALAIAESLKDGGRPEADAGGSQKVTTDDTEGLQDAIMPGTEPTATGTTETAWPLPVPSTTSTQVVSQLLPAEPNATSSQFTPAPVPALSQPIDLTSSSSSDSSIELLPGPPSKRSPATSATSPTFDRASLEKLKHPELKSLAYKNHLPTWGRKVDLISRLVKSTSAVAPSTPTKASSSKKPRQSPPSPSQSQPQPSGIISLLSTPTTASSSAPPSPSKLEASIIGTLPFTYSHPTLLAHFDDIVAFWMGSRAPRGVGVKDTVRCEWCEFKEGCEWREMEGERIWGERVARMEMAKRGG